MFSALEPGRPFRFLSGFRCLRRPGSLHCCGGMIGGYATDAARAGTTSRASRPARRAPSAAQPRRGDRNVATGEGRAATATRGNGPHHSSAPERAEVGSPHAAAHKEIASPACREVDAAVCLHSHHGGICDQLLVDLRVRVPKPRSLVGCARPSGCLPLFFHRSRSRVGILLQPPCHRSRGALARSTKQGRVRIPVASTTQRRHRGCLCPAALDAGRRVRAPDGVAVVA